MDAKFEFQAQKLGGYQKSEVDAYVGELQQQLTAARGTHRGLVAENQRLLTEQRQLKDDAAQVDEAACEACRLGYSPQEVLGRAQGDAALIRAEAQRAAQRIMTQAHQQAATIFANAKDAADRQGLTQPVSQAPVEGVTEADPVILPDHPTVGVAARATEAMTPTSAAEVMSPARAALIETAHAQIDSAGSAAFSASTAPSGLAPTTSNADLPPAPQKRSFANLWEVSQEVDEASIAKFLNLEVDRKERTKLMDS